MTLLELLFGTNFRYCLAYGADAHDHRSRRILTDVPRLKTAKDYYMSEVRQTLDGHRDFLPSNSGPLKPSQRIVQLSLADAIRSAIAGEIDAKAIYKQMPDQVRSSLEAFAKTTFGKGLDTLSGQEDRELLLLLQGAANTASESETPNSSRRSEVRADSSRDFFPSQEYSSTSTGVGRAILVTVAGALLIVALWGLWRWLAK